MRRAVLTLCLAMTAVPVAGGLAQTPLHLDGRLLPMVSDSYAIYYLRGSDTMPAGVLSDKLEVHGDTLTRRYSEYKRATGRDEDVIVSHLPDLRPLSYTGESPEMVAAIRFSADSAQGWMKTPDGDSVPIRVPTGAGVYDGTSFDLVVRASPLHDGFELTVPIFVEGTNAVTTVGGRVTGADSIDGHDCWVFAGHFGQMSVTFWIDKANRELRQQLLRPSVTFAILYSPHRLRAAPKRPST